MFDLKYCTNCLFPKTKPDLEFDKNRICMLVYPVN